jgi:rhodanese-related sulfurtransferase
MIRKPAKSAVFLLALVFAACAEPQAPSAVKKPAEAAAVAEKPYKKPPRMLNRGKITSISFEQFFPLQQAGKVMIFDARQAFFYKLGHLPGAIHLPPGKADTLIHEREASIESALAAGKTLVVYCSGPGCPDARAVAMHLSGFGYPASVFSGGWQAWTDAGMPAE